MVATGSVNAFGLRVTAQSGGVLDVVCPVCHTGGQVVANEFESTRCGSARCGSTQGSAELGRAE